MRLFSQGSTRLRFGRSVAGMAIFLLLTAIPCIAAADPIGAFASPAQVMSTNGPVAAGDQSFSEPLAAAAAMPAPIKRGFYLTSTLYATNVPLTACATGYHMASIWELLDVSTMNYHYKHPKAKIKDDSGKGPPSVWNGWVRTGGDSSTSSTAGTGNCSNWTSVSASDYGVSVRLTNDWKNALGALGPWEANSYPCNFTGPVWCVSNVR